MRIEGWPPRLWLHYRWGRFLGWLGRWLTMTILLAAVLTIAVFLPVPSGLAPSSLDGPAPLPDVAT